MHELGIVYHIIRDVENVARANGVRRVSSVTLLLGEVSGVVPDLLLDAWRWAADKKSITQGAELIVEPVEAAAGAGNVGGAQHHGLRRKALLHIKVDQLFHLPVGQRTGKAGLCAVDQAGDHGVGAAGP